MHRGEVFVLNNEQKKSQKKLFYFLKNRFLKFNFSFPSQLELITELLGTPSMEDMRHACDGARTHMLRRVPKQPSLSALYTLSSHATHEAVHLLCQMLVFDPVSMKLIQLLGSPDDDD